MTSSGLVRLVYASRALVGDHSASAEAVADILAAARWNNLRDGITGALVFDGTTFGQVLEGPDAAVEAVFRRIRRDPRHETVTALGIQSIGARTFAGSPMAFVAAAADATPAEFARWRMALKLSTMSGPALHDLLQRLGRTGVGRDAGTPQ